MSPKERAEELTKILTEANLWSNLCLDSHTKAKQAIKCNKNFFNKSSFIRKLIT